MNCFDCCAEPTYESDPIEIIDNYPLHVSNNIACLSETDYNDGWNLRNSNMKAMKIDDIGLKQLSEILNSEQFQFAQLETVNVWLDTLNNDLEGAAELVGFQSFFRRHKDTLQEVNICTSALFKHSQYEDTMISKALQSEIMDASKCLANLKAVFFGALSISNQILGTFESASQLRYLRIDFDTLADDFKICAPNLEYFKMSPKKSSPVKVDLSGMKNLIKVECEESTLGGHRLVLSSENRRLRWLDIPGHVKVEGDISKVMVLVLFFGHKEQIEALIGRCKSSLRELQLYGSRNVEVDAFESIRVLDIRSMKNFSLRTSQSRPLDALYIEKVEFSNPANPVHARRVCIVGDKPVDKRIDGITHLAFISLRSTYSRPSMQTVVNNRMSLEALFLSTRVVSPLPELPNIKFLFLSSLEDLIAYAAACGDQLEQVAAFSGGDQQQQDLVRKTVCSNLDLVVQSQVIAWQYWRSYGGFSSNLWSDHTAI